MAKRCNFHLFLFLFLFFLLFFSLIFILEDTLAFFFMGFVNLLKVVNKTRVDFGTFRRFRPVFQLIEET